MSDNAIRKNAILGELATAAVHRFIAARCEELNTVHVLQRLSDESMNHAKRLAGEDPEFLELARTDLTDIYRTEGGWDVGDVLDSPCDTTRAMLQAALKAERGAAAFYRRALQEVESATLRELLLCIAREEDSHVLALERIIASKPQE